MNEHIKCGDLVMVVRGHHCIVKVSGGIPFTVTGFVEPIGGGWLCNLCGQYNAAGNEVAATGFGKPVNGRYPKVPLSWLKKIDPPAEGETREAYKGVTVPA